MKFPRRISTRSITLAENTLSFPKVNPIVKWFCLVFYKLSSWKIDNNIPDDPKSILVFAPHTTNWDFPIIISAAFAIGVRPQWFGKHTMFKGPLKWLYLVLGGIPLDRTQKTNMVEQSVNTIKERDQVMIGIAPEGTRSKSDHWKSGFYHIANLAQIPINFGYIDYPSRTVGIAGGFIPSGDIDADLKIIQDFFADKRGKYPEKMGKIQFRPKTP